jgi:flagellin
LYSQEFTQLQDYVRQTVTQTFNSVSLFSEDPLAVTIDSSGTTFDMAPINLSKSEYTSSLSVAQLLTTANVQNIARDTTGKIQLTVTEEEYLKMPKGGSLTLSGFTSGTPTSGTSTDLTGLNGTFDITDSFKVTDTSATPTHRYIIELDGTAGGTTALGAFTTFTSTTTSGVTTRTVPAIPSTGILTGSTSGIATAVAGKTGLDITSVPRAQAALARIRNSIDKLAQDRASLGAVQSRLNFTNEQLTVTKENLSAAISRIADVDVAEEATAYARYQILVQSGTSMLAQANKMPQSALQLLQG